MIWYTNIVLFHGILIYMIIYDIFNLLYYSCFTISIYVLGKNILYFLSLSSVDQVLIYQNIWSTELKFRKHNNFFSENVYGNCKV